MARPAADDRLAARLNPRSIRPADTSLPQTATAHRASERCELTPRAPSSRRRLLAGYAAFDAPPPISIRLGFDASATGSRSSSMPCSKTASTFSASTLDGSVKLRSNAP